jgi:uncharacterized protein YpmB
MNILLILSVVVIIACIIGISSAVLNVIKKGDQAEMARRDAIQARYDLAQAERDLAEAKGESGNTQNQVYVGPPDSLAITVPDPDGKIAQWKAQNGYGY